MPAATRSPPYDGRCQQLIRATHWPSTAPAWLRTAFMLLIPAGIFTVDLGVHHDLRTRACIEAADND